MPVSSETRPGSRGRGRHRLTIGGAAVLALLLAGAVAAQEPSTRSGEALRLAREASDRKDFDRASTILEGALRSDPDDKDMLSLQARVQAWSRHFDASIATYRKLLALAPDDAFDRAGYARTLAWAGKTEASLPEFRRAIAQDSTDLETRI